MNLRLSLSTLFAFGLVLPAPVSVRAQEPAAKPMAQRPAPAVADDTASDQPTLQATFVGGAQYRNDVDRLGLGRFEQYRDVRQGGALEFARLAYTPLAGHWTLSFTARDAFQDDQRYLLDWTLPARVRVHASYYELPRFYSAVAQALWSGRGTGNLTLSEDFRATAEAAAGVPNAPFAPAALQEFMSAAVAGAPSFEQRTKRKDLNGGVELRLASGLTLGLNGRYERRDGTRPLGFGTYIRRQALSGVPGTGAGFFWRESVEPRGAELVEPVDYGTSEASLTLTWAKNGHSLAAGWFGSRFRNDTEVLFFDNPFEASPGRASATVFDPRAEQEPAAPAGNNNLRGLFARSSMQLWPDNDYSRIFANGSLRIGGSTRLTAVVAGGRMEQDQPFQPYAENPAVVFSQAGQPVEYANQAALPRASLGGEMNTTQADVKLTTRLGPVSARAAYRRYELEDERPSILFPGFSSSGDAYFRAGIGQRDSAGNRVLFNSIGGYSRQRANVGAALRLGPVTVDGEYTRTMWDYEERQVDKTNDDAFRGTLRVPLGPANVNAFYLRASRDFEGEYQLGLETSGVRAYDVWRRDRDQVGVDADLVVGERLMLAAGVSWWSDEYPGAVQGLAYGYGLQDTSDAAYYAGATWTKADWLVGAWVGFDTYDWNSLQVTKTSQTTDYNPTNRWSREASDGVFWIGLEGVAPLAPKLRLRGDLNYQRFNGDWTTVNLATPDVNSAVAYPYPEFQDSTFTARASLSWEFRPRISFEGRYWFEPFRLDDFTWDLMQPYMQGVFQETRSAPGDIGPMNAGRFLFLNSRYGDYTAHVLSAFVHVRF